MLLFFPSGALSVMYYFNTAHFIYKSHTVTLRPFLRHNSYGYRAKKDIVCQLYCQLLIIFKKLLLSI